MREPWGNSGRVEVGMFGSVYLDRSAWASTRIPGGLSIEQRDLTIMNELRRHCGHLGVEIWMQERHFSGSVQEVRMVREFVDGRWRIVPGWWVSRRWSPERRLLWIYGHRERSREKALFFAQASSAARDAILWIVR